MEIELLLGWLHLLCGGCCCVEEKERESAGKKRNLKLHWANVNIKVVREVRRSSIQCMGKVTGGGGGYNKEAYKERKIKS